VVLQQFWNGGFGRLRIARLPCSEFETFETPRRWIEGHGWSGDVPDHRSSDELFEEPLEIQGHSKRAVKY
jgi:hypothetical protein